MAEMKLQFIIDAQDRSRAAFKNVEKNMGKLQGRLKDLGPTFKKMALIGTAAFAAIGVAAGSSIKAAMIAEGAYNKFNTVFGKHKDDMLKFVKDIRTRMPTATHEIVIMLSGLQDLLVPMGVAREEAAEMTKGFLEVANQVAAFNDVPVKEVLEAIRSGLVGSSEPLRRYGIDTRVTTLEALALSEGLIKEGESFAELTPKVRSQITAQTVLIQITNQSSDAIAGFEVNQDSALRRTEELTASIIDSKVAIGDALLPLYDSILKKLLPILASMGTWIKENPKLTKIIILGVAALTALVAVLGFVGLVLPVVITGFGLLAAVSLPITAIILAIIVVLGLFIAIGWTLYKDWDQIIKGFKIMWDEFLDKIMSIWGSITDVFKNAWQGIKDIVGSAIDWLMRKMQPFINAFEKVKSGASWLSGAVGGAAGILGFAKGGIVPGALGQPIAAIVHGGERIIPVGGRGGGNIYNITITGNTFMADRDAALEIGDAIIDVLKENMKL